MLSLIIEGKIDTELRNGCKMPLSSEVTLKYSAEENMTSGSLVTPTYTNEDINKQLIGLQAFMFLLFHNGTLLEY